MSMKSIVHSLAVMSLAMVINEPQMRTGGGTYIPRIHGGRRYKPFHVDPPAKGHKAELMGFGVRKGNKIFTIDILVSFGTKKSRDKKVNLLDHELREYISKTPLEEIIKFNQFTIIEDEK